MVISAPFSLNVTGFCRHSQNSYWVLRVMSGSQSRGRDLEGQSEKTLLLRTFPFALPSQSLVVPGYSRAVCFKLLYFIFKPKNLLSEIKSYTEPQ
jgi:hypothetical protein